MHSLPWITVTNSPGGTTLTYFEPGADILAVASTERPSYVTVVGKRSKTVLLDMLLGNTVSIPVHKQIYLWSSPKLQSHNTPLVVIDCNPQNLPNREPDIHDSSRLLKAWSMRKHSNISALLCGKVFSQFSSVLCCFVSDLGGPRAVANWLADLILATPTFDLQIAPRILLVVETTSDTFDESIAAEKAANLVIEAIQDKEHAAIAELSQQLQIKIKQVIDNIEVLGLQSWKTTILRARGLKRRLLAISDVSMRERARLLLQFSFRHFQELTKQALEHISTDVPGPLCLASATRPRGYSTDHLEQCLEDFLHQVPSQSWLWHFVAPIIGSALLLDSYPPRAHEFTSDYLFEKLYFNSCLAAIRTYTPHADIQNKFMNAIRDEFRESFVKFTQRKPKRSQKLASQSHRQVLSLKHAHLAELKSHRSCFCCFMRMPEKVMACGHALCDSCIKIFGTRSRTERNTFELHECILCGVNYRSSVFQFVPPTAGIRILSVDGGGIKGIIPLMYLKHLDTSLAPLRCSIKDCFDFVCGTSAGGLVVIGLFLLQWSATESIIRFEEVASKTFGKRRALLARALQLIVGYVEDGQYSLAAVQDAFRKTFNSPLQMFNPLRNDTKVAVTTTAVKDSLPWLFTNYNGGKRSDDLGYDVVRARKAHHDITVSDAACCTSAAPWFFKPQMVSSLGSFQDGGLQHNNPASMAQWEMRFVWPSKPEPDFALSLGTGTSPPAAAKDLTKSRFYVRLFNSFMRNLDGEDAWKRFFNSLPSSSRHRFHRLNITFDGPEPSLDDAMKIPELKNAVLKTIESNEDVLAGVLDSIYASMFYFELEEVPPLEQGTYLCSGFIFCRLDLPPDGLRHLYSRLLENCSFFLVQGCPIRCVDSVPDCIPPYRRRVSFRVETLEEVISLTIRGFTKTTKALSGFPTTLQKLIDAQQLESPFGTTEHAVWEKSLPAIPSKREFFGDERIEKYSGKKVRNK